MTPSIYIVDDEAPARARLATLLADIAEACPHTLVGEAGLPQTALDDIAALRPDIVLLDVQMPGMSGLELAAQLAAGMPEPPAVVFVSAFDDYALHAFEVQAHDYLLKPVRAERLAQAIRRAASLRGAQGQTPAPLSGKPARRHFSVQMRGRLLLVPVDEVLYLKADLKYVALRTTTQTHLIEDSLVSLEEELAEQFVRVHRNALVARRAIAGVERGKAVDDTDTEKSHDGWEVLLAGIEERLPISRRQWPVVKALVK